MRRPRTTLVIALLVHLVSATLAGAAALDVPIIFTRLPRQPELEQQTGRCDGILPAEYGADGRIVRLDPDGRLRTLTGDFDSACGADVSFDGQRIIFAAKRQPGDPWGIWEMKADGSGARPITRVSGHCRSPAYLSTLYTLTSTEPTYQVAFVSDAAGWPSECAGGLATSLYTCGLAGDSLRRLTFNLGSDQSPLALSGGRILLASSQRSDLRGFGGRVALFDVNTDGTDYALYCGDEGRPIKHMPCATTDGLVVFVESAQLPWDGAGQLACVTTRRPFHSYRAITQDEKLLYHSPAPLPDGRLLVSRRAADGSTSHGLYRLDALTGVSELVLDEPDTHDMYARALVPRREPDGRSSAVREEATTGELYCLNAYLAGSPMQPHLAPGLIRRLRVVEGVPECSPARRGPVAVVARRIVGDFAIESDGSFRIELPANLPVQLQALDDNGMALATCSWIWVRPREPRGCIGCHEDPELTPENRLVLALEKPAVDLTLPAERRRTVEFGRDIGPILDRKCVGCHDGREGTVLDLRDFSESVAGSYVRAGQARTSPLIWRLYGRNMSRPWDASSQTRPRAGICPPAGAVPLTGAETSALVEWTDLGALGDGNSAGQEQR